MKKIIMALVGLAMVASSCSDWTTPGSLDQNVNSPDKQNPELWAAYIKSLNEYKATTHKVMFVSIDNPAETATGQAQRLTALPDSVDYIVLNNPFELAPITKNDMVEVREKGTKVIYTIDYDALEADWQQFIKNNPWLAEEDSGVKFEDFVDIEIDAWKEYGYDGFIFSYNGRSAIGMNDEAKAQYEARQKNVFDLVAAWRTANPDRVLVFRGNPQYLTAESKALLAKCNYIILPTDLATATGDMETAAAMAVAGGDVPSDRFVFATYTTQWDDTSFVYGYFGTLGADGKKLHSIPVTAEWMNRTSPDFTRAGMMINRVQYDYYNTQLVYSTTRRAIATMNPSPKN